MKKTKYAAATLLITAGGRLGLYDIKVKYNMTQHPATNDASNGLLRMGFRQIIYVNVRKKPRS